MSDDILRTQETYTEEDFNTGYKLVPEGEQHLRIESVEGEMHEYESYTGPRAKMKIALVSDPSASFLSWVTLPHPNSSEGSKKHRALILSRLGFITKGDGETAAAFDWKKLEGVEFLGDVEHTERDGKTYAGLTFDGWHSLDQTQTAVERHGDVPAATSGGADSFGDI